MDDDEQTGRLPLWHVRPFVSSPAGLAASPRLAVLPCEEQEQPEQTSILARIAAERAEAPALWDELQRVHPVRRGLLVRNERRFQTWGLFDLLLRTSRQSALPEPGTALALARLALTVLEGIAHQISKTATSEYRASALVALAEAARGLGRVPLAEQTLKEATGILRQDTRDPFLTAQVHAARGRLAAELGRLREASRAFGSAARLLERLGNVRAAAGLRVEQAGAIGPSAPDQAVRLIERAWPHLDFVQEPGLELVAHHRLIWYTNDAGRPWLAGQHFDAAQEIYRRQRAALVRLHRQWLEGRILRNCGDLAPAEPTLLRAYDAFTEIGHPLDLVLCGLDRVELYRLLREDRRAERLVSDVAAALAEWNLSPQALALWRQAQLISKRSEFARLALAFRESWYPFTAASEPGS